MAPDPFLDLADACLHRIEAEGMAAIDSLCREHPEHADRLRRVLGCLVRVGLVCGEVSPQSVGNYRLVRRLGSGGMGVVYEAFDERLSRRVALKLIHGRGLASDNARRRFEREIAAISRLDHPGICTVFEAGEADGTPYLAMRLVEGETLATHLARARAAAAPARASAERDRIAWCVDIVAKVARAVHAAHAAGIVHRDLKPQNVMLDAHGQPVVLDFGLARTADTSDGLTASGDQPGTPAYMAPEQVDPRRGPIDARTDVYGLGALLYECLALRPPFAGASRDSVLRDVLHADPLALRRLNPGVGRDLCVVVERALDKEPRRRFAAAVDLADELDRIRRHEPIRSRRAGLPLRLRRWMQRNPTAAGVLAVTGLALVVALFLLRQATQARAELRALALSTTAMEVLAENPVLAAKLAREAVRARPVREHTARLQCALAQIHEVWRFELPDARQLRRVDWSRDASTLLVVADNEGRPALLAADGALRARLDVRCAHDAAAWSPDGTRVAIGDAEGFVRIFDAGGQQEGAALELGQCPLSVRWSPDGARLVAGGGGGRVRVWRRDRGAAEATWEGPATAAFRVAFTTDGARVVIAGGTGEVRVPGADYAVRLWNADGSEPEVLHAHAHTVWSVVCVAGRIASGSADGSVRLWDAGGRPCGEFVLPDDAVFSVDAAPDGSHFAVATNHGEVLVLDRDAEVAARWRTEQGTSVTRATFSPDGESVVTAGWNQLVQVWHWRTRQLALSLRGHLNGVTHAAFSPDGARIASVGWDGAIACCSLLPRGQRTRSGYGAAWYVAPLADGSIVAASRSGELRRETQAGSEILASGLGRPAALRTTADRRRLLLCAGTTLLVGAPGDIARIDVEVELRDGVFARHTDIVLATAQGLCDLAPDGTRTTWGGTADLPGCTRIDLGHAGDTLVVGHVTGEVTVWDVVSRRLLHRHRLHAAFVTDVELARDGGTLLTASEDGTAAVSDLRTGARLRLLTGHQGGVMTATFSPDAAQAEIATAAHDDTVRLWDRATGMETAVLRGHAEGVRDVRYLADGSALVSASSDGTVRWWPLSTEGVLASAEACGLGELTGAERARFPRLFR